MDTPSPQFLLEKIVAHLSGSVRNRVHIATAYRITAYAGKHIGMFRIGADGSLQAQHGKSWNTIATKNGPLVGIRLVTK